MIESRGGSRPRTSVTSGERVPGGTYVTCVTQPPFVVGRLDGRSPSEYREVETDGGVEEVDEGVPSDSSVRRTRIESSTCGDYGPTKESVLLSTKDGGRRWWNKRKS